ncbi:MAG: VCBS repeat-containing protein, partial [Planctomycetales bacterium]|nr:VCBS repeat-containing protein [Planctomycetales bacterium]
PVSLDEFTADSGQGQSWMPVDDAEKQRKEKIWPTYFSGGMIEFILEGLLDLDSFKTPAKAELWRYLGNARHFMESELPFWEMAPHDDLSRGATTIDVGMGGGKTSSLGAQVFAKPGQVYAVYFPSAMATGELDLSATDGPLMLRWYDPRAGEFDGDVKTVVGGDWTAVGPPPSDPEQDWVALLRASEAPANETPANALPANKTSSNNDAATGNAISRQAFPGESWQTVEPSVLGLDAGRLDALAEMLGGRGAVVKDGVIVKSWGDQTEKSDWFSAAKPVLGTLLLFAVTEGRLDGVDAPLVDFGWELSSKDKKMTLRHLANMTSGYARPDPPGEAWAYNDFGIQLYQQTIFDRIFMGEPKRVANDGARFGALGLEDGLSFAKANRRLKASVRDFARIGWFWLNRGNWDGRQLIPGYLFDEVMRPQVPPDLPHTAEADTNDYLGIGSFGGGSDHFTKFGAGAYGFNWWFNRTGRLHPEHMTWPDAPDDVVMAIGFGGNCCALLPSENAVLVAATADWGKLRAGDSDTQMNHVLAAFAASVTPENAPPQTVEAGTTGGGFDKVVLTREYLCDGINRGDINRDGHVDVVAGPYWYAGPDFTSRQAFYPPVPLEPTKSPSNSMFSFVYDFNDDGWPDVLTLGRVHLHPAYWYENPGEDGGPWQKHYAFERVQGESPTLVDLDGDGRPQIVCHWEGRWGWIEPDWQAPTEPWRFQPISDPGEWKEFYHGTGVGDLNGDGRLDLVLNDGWFTQPENPRSVWTWHPYQFSDDRGGAQMYVDDVDQDGDADVVTSLNAHGWGLAWFEQASEAGEAVFRRHPIMGDRDAEETYGVAFTQPHALDLADLDGDGDNDLVVGKRMWAHGPHGDIEPNAPPVLYWFELVQKDGAARYIPHRIDDRSGVGVQLTVADVDGDGANDVLTASKLGSFVFLNRLARDKAPASEETAKTPMDK